MVAVSNCNVLTHVILLTWMCALRACTALVHDQPLAISPSRIVAGHEPEKTNEFLQAIARAVQKKVFLT